MAAPAGDSLRPPDQHEAPAVVGVVIAAYQAERFLDATLRSLQAQTANAWRCVVVDDGSTDRTSEITTRFAESDARITLHRQANSGVSAARNAGLRLLPPEAALVCFLDSDDLLLPDALETMSAVLARRPEAVGCSGWAESINAAGEAIDPGHHREAQRTRRTYRGIRSRILEPHEDSTFESLAVNGAIWPPATAVLRRDVVERVGGFDQGLRSQEDWDLFLRVARNGPIAFVDRQVAWYRQHGENATGDNVEYLRCMAAVRLKTWRDPDNTAAQRRLILRVHLRYHTWVAKRQLELLPDELRQRRWGAVAAGLSWTLFGVAHLLRRPQIPRRDHLAVLVGLEERHRGNQRGATFL